MPSPFPGMDPYFEGDLWTPFHTAFGVEIAQQLTPLLLLNRYFARPEKRSSVERDELVEIRDPSGKLLGIFTPSTQKPGEQVWVSIRNVKDRKLVTAIEILSPFKKTGKGRKAFLSQRANILREDVHLLELDLLREGERLPTLDKLPSAAYYIFLSRAYRRQLAEIWPIRLDQMLPKVPVPLFSGDADVVLDL